MARRGLHNEAAELLRSAGVDERRLVAIPNGIDLARFRPPDPEERRRARQSLELPAEATIVERREEAGRARASPRRQDPRSWTRG
jgi:glycosyltransferase involved in cell wall biosynthesis